MFQPVNLDSFVDTKKTLSLYTVGIQILTTNEIKGEEDIRGAAWYDGTGQGIADSHHLQAECSVFVGCFEDTFKPC